MELIAALVEVEREFDILSWRAADVHLWPLIRCQIAARALDAGRARLSGQSASGGRRPGLWRRARALSSEIVGTCVPYFMDARQNQSLAVCSDVVMLAAANHRRIMRGGRWYSIYTDPLVDEYRRMGHRTHVWERRNAPFRVPRYNPSRFLPLDRALGKLHRPETKVGRAEFIKLRGYGAFCAALEQRFGLDAPSIELLTRTVQRMFRASEIFARAFDRLAPRVGFVVCYYQPESWAFTLACRRLGIPSVDIQHGVQGRYHFAYGQWSRLPPCGFDLLPNVFWCWSDPDVAAVREWAGDGAGHIAVRGGNPWIEIWKAHRDEFSSDSQGHASLPRGETTVLYTCSLDPWLPPELAEAMRMAPASWVWWIRAHPGMPKAVRESLREQLRTIVNVTWVLDDWDVPIVDALAAADVHLTRASSVVLDAAAIGVKSVVMLESSKLHYHSQIQAGLAVVAQTPEAIVTAIGAQSGRHPEVERSQDPIPDRDLLHWLLRYGN